jgi:hypothetical protein
MNHSVLHRAVVYADLHLCLYFLYNALKILIVANIPVSVLPKVGPGFKGIPSSSPVTPHGAAGCLTGHVESEGVFIGDADRENA